MTQSGETKWIILRDKSSNLKCFLFFFFLLLKRGSLGGWDGSVSDPVVIKFLLKIFFRLIPCQNVFCKCLTEAIYLEQKLIRTYFHMWLCILPLCGQTWFLFYRSSTRPCYCSAFTLWNSVLILKRPLCFKGLHFCLRWCFSFPPLWSSTAPCCLEKRLPIVLRTCNNDLMTYVL